MFFFHFRYLLFFLAPCFPDGSVVHFVRCLTIKCAIVPKSSFFFFNDFVYAFWHYFVQHAYYIEFLGTCLCAHGRGATAVNQIFNAWHFVKYNQFSGEPFYCDQRLMG